MSLRERKLAAARQQVAAEAMRLFGERGYDAVTVDEVAEAAEVARRTVHRYYPLKSDLVFARAEEMTQLLGRYVETIRTDGPLPVALFEAVRALAADWPYAYDEAVAFAGIVAGSAELRARGLAKRAALREWLQDALAERRPEDPDQERRLWSELAVALFYLAESSWLSEGGELVRHVDRVVEAARRGFAVGTAAAAASSPDADLGE